MTLGNVPKLHNALGVSWVRKIVTVRYGISQWVGGGGGVSNINIT